MEQNQKISEQELRQFRLLQLVLKASREYGFECNELIGKDVVSRTTFYQIRKLRLDDERGIIRTDGVKKRETGRSMLSRSAAAWPP